MKVEIVDNEIKLTAENSAEQFQLKALWQQANAEGFNHGRHDSPMKTEVFFPLTERYNDE